MFWWQNNIETEYTLLGWEGREKQAFTRLSTISVENYLNNFVNPSPFVG